MLTLKTFLALSLAITLIFTQTTTITSTPLNLTALNITLDNYFGCAKWDGESCLSCSSGFFFNSNGICCQVSPQCKIFNTAVGKCDACYNGYALDSNGSCAINAQIDTGCVQWDNKSVCT